MYVDLLLLLFSGMLKVIMAIIPTIAKWHLLYPIMRLITARRHRRP